MQPRLQSATRSVHTCPPAAPTRWYRAADRWQRGKPDALAHASHKFNAVSSDPVLPSSQLWHRRILRRWKAPGTKSGAHPNAEMTPIACILSGSPASAAFARRVDATGPSRAWPIASSFEMPSRVSAAACDASQRPASRSCLVTSIALPPVEMKAAPHRRGERSGLYSAGITNAADGLDPRRSKMIPRIFSSKRTNNKCAKAPRGFRLAAPPCVLMMPAGGSSYVGG
jgi:hypothetical protein